MKTLKPIIYKLATAAGLLVFCSCHFTSTESIGLQFNNNEKAIADSINNVYHFQSINVDGKKLSSTDGNHTILAIKFTNGYHIPKDNSQENKLAKELGMAVLRSVKDSAMFDQFNVTIAESSSNGIITSNVYHRFDFGKKELYAK